MSTAKVTLNKMLKAREERADFQYNLISRYGCSLISFTMNIPGSVKQNELICLAFDAGVEKIINSIGIPIAKYIKKDITGCEAFLVYNYPAEYLKKVCIRIEDESEIGRLYDIDVLNYSCEKLSRTSQRKCIICGGPAFICSRSRVHGIPAVVSAVNNILLEFASEYLADIAADALRREVCLTPKPGLVDMNNNGSHCDMSIQLFHKSIEVIRPYFKQMVILGMNDASFDDIYGLGLEAERAMFCATNGINTHKGALYSFSLMLASHGYFLKYGGDVFEKVRTLAELTPLSDKTHGDYVRKQYNVGGAREEARKGFPTARKASRILKSGDLFETLLWLMSNTNDSNIYYRGGSEGDNFIKDKAAEILSATPENRMNMLKKFDREMIERNLSPGGCADLLALAIYINKFNF